MASHLEAEALFHAGTRLMDDDAQAAERAFRQALGMDANIPEVHANLALLLERNGKTKEAEQHYRRALALRPALTQASLNLGVMLDGLRRFEEAEATYRQALALEPDSACAWSNLGVLLAGLKREEEAEGCYRRALALDSGYGKAAFNLAYLLLRQGRYAEGWERLESRPWVLPLEQHLPCPRWHGEPLQGKSLLIGLEAGHGDMIQFSRYADLAKRAGASRVGILCQPALHALFRQHRYLDDAFAIDTPFAADAWDFWVPPLSLPHLFKTRIDTIPAALPYLGTDSERVARWTRLIGHAQGRLRIGLAWRGNPNFENDRDRSLPSLSTLAPLADVPGVHFFSLQKGEGEEETSHSPFPLTNPAPDIADFADTAAIVAKLDLVITVDTAVAHLSAALGQRCWLLLPYYKPDWRWLSDRRDSPWYPDVMRLFWQPRPGDWPTVIAEIAAELRTLAEAGIASRP